MKTTVRLLFLLALAANVASGGIPFVSNLLNSSAFRKQRTPMFGMTSRAALGVRYHPMHSAIEKWPYDGDLSYGLSYALYEGTGYLELGLDYAPEGTADSIIDDVLTPRLNMAIRDGYFVAGIGIADGYVSRKIGSSEWTGLLYQFHLGLEFPVGERFEVGGGTYYSFEAWDELGEFDAADLEYGVRLGYLF